MQIDVGKIIDNSRVSKLHVLIVSVGAMVLIVDGWELVSMGLVIPRMADQWGVDPSGFAMTLSMAMFGVMVGSLVAGTLGDYIGRRRAMLATVCIAGIFMLLTPSANSMTQLTIYRFFTGLGAGGCIPITITYASEYMPVQFRNRLVVLMYTGAAFGSVLASLSAPTILAFYDWQGVFIAGGILSVLSMIIVYFSLPESLKFLISKNIESSVAARLLKRIDRSFDPQPDDEYFVSEPSRASEGSPVRQLFGDGQTAITLLAWSVMIGNQFMVFLIGLWMPTLLTEGGIHLESALYISAAYHFGGIAGGLLFAWFADKLGAGRVLTITYPIAGISVVLLGMSLNVISVLPVVAVISGAFLIGSSFCLAPYVANLYPTRTRSTGVGWALSIGRIGSILSPLVGGFALGQDYEISTILFVAGLPPVLCGLLIWFLNRQILTAASSRPQTFAV